MKYFLLSYFLFFQLISFSQKAENKYELLFTKTYNLMKDDEYYKAIQVIDSTLIEIEKSKGPIEEKAKFFTLKAAVYENMYENELSNKYNLEAMQLFDSINSEYYYSWTYSILVGNYMYQKNYKEFYKNLPIIKKILKDDFLIFYIYEMELRALYNQKKYDELLAIVDVMIVKLKNTKHNSPAFSKETYNYKSIYNILKAFSFFETKQYNKASALLNKLTNINFNDLFWLDEDALKFEPKIYQYKLEILLKNKQYDSLAYYYNKYTIKNENLFLFTKKRINKNKKILNEILNDEKKILKKNLSLKIQKQQYKNRLYLIVSLIGLITLLIYVYFRNKHSILVLKNNTEINKLNSELLLNNAELKKKNLKNQELINFNERNIFSKTVQISTIRDKIKKITSYLNKLTSDEVLINNSHLFKVENELETIITENDIWTEFKIQFEKIRPNFFKDLKTINPNLTVNDLKHCAYIITNLKVKEVANLIYISHRSVETARYRLRKKLYLEKNTKLYDFLNNL